MKRNLTRWLIGTQIVSLTLTGCAPTQPFFFGERGNLAHYIDRAQQIEYPDLHTEPLPEVTQAQQPLSLDNQNFEYTDLTLEECISIALANTHIVRALPGTQRQNADFAAVGLSSPSQQLTTVYDPAITATTTNSQPLVIDSTGNRVQARGSARANQVGGVEDALAEFDAQYSSFLSFNTTDRARNVNAAFPQNVLNPQFFQARDTTAQMAISKRMATGGIATLLSQSIYSFNNIPVTPQGRAVPSDYTQVLEAQIQHPLARGRGTLVNRIPVVLARINEDISMVQYEERIRNVIRDVEFAYWDLYAAYWNFETAKQARDSAALSHKIALAKFNKGNAANGEAQARLTYHQFEAQVKAALAGGGQGDPGLFGREQQLRLLMGWSASDGRLVRPIDKPAVGLASFDWESVKAEVLTRNPDLRLAKWLIKQRELELVSSKNQILPDVNLNLIYRWVGVGSSLIDRRGNNPRFATEGTTASAWEELLEGNFQEGAVRLDFTPNAFGARRQLADITRSQLELSRAHKVLEFREEASISLAARYWQQIESLHQQMTEQFQALNAAQTLVEVSQARFDKGDANQDVAIDNLLRAQQSRAQAGQNYNRLVAEYNKSLVEMHALKGSLLEYNNVTLEEGLWAEKAYWDAYERARERDAARYMDYGASRPKVISQGEYQQFTGSAQEQVRPANRKIPSAAETETEEGAPEVVPSQPSEPEIIPPERRAMRNRTNVRG